MTEDEFWEHIRASEPDPLDPDAQADRLTARLAKLPPDDILDFDVFWDLASDRAYRRAMWDAASLINGGCSDDGFQYFRWWLILQGREVLEAAVADPDTLAGVVAGGLDEYEAEVYPGPTAWHRATGIARDEAGYNAYDRALDDRHPGHRRGRRGLVPDPREAEDNRFPRLAALYLDPDD